MGKVGERELLAVLFTDIKGYSAMVGADEAAALRLVTEHRALVREIVARHGGREHRTIGDAFLILFGSAVQAFKCAVEVQERLLARNQERPAGEQVWLRIGLHVGEVVYDDDADVFGDAVNIAARVEAVAPPGGLCLTDAVAAAVRTHTDRKLEPIGVLPLKNIADPPKLYRVVIAPWTPPLRPWPWRAALVAVALAVVVGLGWVAWPWRSAPSWPKASDDPGAQAAFERSIEAMVLGEFPEARRRADEGLARDPESPLLLIAWIVAPVPQGTRAEAVEDAVKLVEGRSDPDAQLVRLVGWTAEDGDDVARGRAWDAWAAANPDHDWGLFLRAVAYPHHADDNRHEPGEIHTNEVVLRAYLEARPDHVGARYFLAREVMNRSAADARELLEGWVAGCECPPLRELLGEAAYNLGDMEAAEAAFRGAVQRDGSLVESKRRLADVALIRGDEGRRQELVAALLSDVIPQDERANFAQGHGMLLVTVGRRGEGRRMYDRCLIENPRWVAATFLRLRMADEDLLVGDPAGARARLDEVDALRMSPEVPADAAAQLGVEVLARRGHVAFAEGDAAEARRILDRLEGLPGDRFGGADRAGMLYGLRWRVLAVERRRDEGLEAARTMFGCWPRYAEGVIEDLAGRPEAALTAFEALYDGVSCPIDRPDLLRTNANVRAAEIALALGDRERAARAVERARVYWREPDADLPLAQRLIAVEGALAP